MVILERGKQNKTGNQAIAAMHGPHSVFDILVTVRCDVGGVSLVDQ